MKTFIATFLALLLLASLTAGSAAVVRTYINETKIENIYKSLEDIKISITSLHTKIDNLKE